MRIAYGYTLKVDSFRRCLHAFQSVLVGSGSDAVSAHRIAWYLANDLYDRLRNGEVDRTGHSLTMGQLFNKVRHHWSMLIHESYPVATDRLSVSYGLVNKAVYMLKHGRLVFI